MTVRVKILRRATALLSRCDEILLLRVHDDDFFHLPGGGVEEGELPIAALARELYEETGLVATRIDYLLEYCDYWGADGMHYSGQVQSVYRVEAEGDVQLGPDHCEHTWRDMKRDITLIDYMRPLLGLVREVSKWDGF